MILLPAIDLYRGQAVRLYKGDFQQMTVYDTDPLNTVRHFEEAGATHLHLVDLEGAKTEQPPTSLSFNVFWNIQGCSSRSAVAFARKRQSQLIFPPESVA
ncbi:MAG: HisA/HisF-related TIM barrel protein [Evtepia sp.]